MWDIGQLAARFWDDLVNRPSGPMAFRFILQPVTATLLALRDGIKDARAGRTPYGWLLLTDASGRKAALREGFRATLRVIILGLVMDLTYQLAVFHALFPLQALFLTFCIAYLPYVALRGPATRIARRWFLRRANRSKP